MLALLQLAGAAQLGEVQISIGMPEAFKDMMTIMEDLAQQVEMRRPPPRNPCMEDMQRLRCSNAACLMANLAKLSPSCAMLLKGRQAEPSPMPVPSGFASMMGLPMIAVEEFSASPSLGGAFEVEGVVDGAMPAEFGALLDALPAELAQLFGADMPRLQPAPRPPAPRPKPEASEHPCKAEVERCIAEIGDTGSAAIRSCLGKHIDDPGFSSTCKCFLHQVDATARKPQPPAANVVRVVPIAMAEPMPPHPMRHAFCMFFMPAFILVFALLLRRCCSCLCSAKPQFAAVVPPEQATIKTVEPLMCVAIKEVPVTKA